MALARRSYDELVTQIGALETAERARLLSHLMEVEGVQVDWSTIAGMRANEPDTPVLRREIVETVREVRRARKRRGHAEQGPAAIRTQACAGRPSEVLHRGRPGPALSAANLAARVEALETEVRSLRQALTPHARFGLMLDRVRAKARRLPSREVDRMVDEELGKVRRDQVVRAAR